MKPKLSPEFQFIYDQFAQLATKSQVADLETKVMAQTRSLQTQISDLASATKEGFDEVTEIRNDMRSLRAEMATRIRRGPRLRS